jgi:NitT/TauT family transport system substrate-binding protein
MPRQLINIVLLVLACFACRSSGGTGSKENYTVASLNGPSSMALIKLIDSLDSEENASVKVMILDEPLQVRKMMLDGSADFAILPTTMAAIMYNKGIGYKLLAVPVWGTLYLLGQDTTITGWEELRGKQVYVMAKGMTPDVLFRYLLEKNGIIPDEDVILDYSFPTHIDLANAVAAGKAGLAVLSEPMVSIVTEKNRNIHPLLDLNEEWSRIIGIPLAQTALLAKATVIESDPVLVEQVINACKRSAGWVNSNPDSAAGMIVRYDILPDAKTAVASIPRSNINFIERYLRIFFNMDPDIIGGRMPDENFIY